MGTALDGSSLVGLLIAMRGEGKMIQEAHLAKGGSPPATLSSVYAGGLHSTTARCSPVSGVGLCVLAVCLREVV